MDDDLMDRVLWQKLQGTGGFFFSFFSGVYGCIYVVIKKRGKIESATVLQSEKNGVGKINGLTRRK